MEISRLGLLADSDDGMYVEAAALVYPELNDSVPEAWDSPLAPSQGGPTGAGVIVGIIDSGVDVNHPSFVDSSGHTRILRLWDQTVASGQRPAAYDYGSEWDSAAIGLEILGSSSPASVDSTGHGTAVAGIIASNGRGGRGYCVGVASEAELIVVKLDAGLDYADTANLTDAVRYIFEVAEGLGKRAVVNLSQGVQRSPRDPNGQLEVLITELLEANQERILVTSAGNFGDAKTHALLQPVQGQSTDLKVDVPRGVGPSVVIDFWSDRTDSLHFQVIDPRGNLSATVTGRTHHCIFTNSDLCDFVRVSNAHGVEADNMLITIRAIPHVSPGAWVVRITGDRVASSSPVHAWLERGLLDSPKFQAPFADASCTVTPPATADGVIVAGSYCMNPTRGQLAQSSGQGPDRTGNPLLLLTAPGEPITSCCPLAQCTSMHAQGAGTSLAAAHVTGAIALMLEKRPWLSRDQVLKCLLQNARTDQDTQAGPPNAWGAGKLNIHAALNCP
ncbi:S8 family serine peptidase [Streptomyces sp. NPDC002144]